MADVIKKFNYSKTRGRGRGILGLTNFNPCRRPGERSSSAPLSSSAPQTAAAVKEPSGQSRVEKEQTDESSAPARLLIASHNYQADSKMSGGFRELSLEKGADASKCKVYGPRLEDGHVGRPSSFMIVTRDAGASTLQVRLHGAMYGFEIIVDLTDIRKLKVNYDPRKPGDCLVTIKWSEKHIPGSPFRVKITGENLIIATDSPKQAVKATPRDKSLNPIAEEADEGDIWGDEEEEEANTANPALI